MITYNPDTPPERQISSWACSIRTATWMLKSVGVQIDAGQMQDEMVPTYVTPDLGLLDGRGIGLAEVLRRHLPPETPVEVLWAPSWDDVVARAGRGPIGIGAGRPLYHWLNVARVLSPGVLDAPNPAPNYPPGAPLHDNLTRAEFDKYAPWALVFVQVAPVAKPVPPAPTPVPPSFRVGPGVLAEMARRGDEPITSEVYFKDDAGVTQYSATIGRSGSTYQWAPSTGLVYVTHTDATAAGRS
jgi:hypothetical protein